METFTITIERNEDQAQLLRDLAAFYKMDVPAFLRFALTRGISSCVNAMEDGNGPVDDGIPF